MNEATTIRRLKEIKENLLPIQIKRTQLKKDLYLKSLKKEEGYKIESGVLLDKLKVFKEQYKFKDLKIKELPPIKILDKKYSKCIERQRLK